MKLLLAGPLLIIEVAKCYHWTIGVIIEFYLLVLGYGIVHRVYCGCLRVAGRYVTQGWITITCTHYLIQYPNPWICFGETRKRYM
jgi:hypothetical protein